jgi:hypothetical protein
VDVFREYRVDFLEIGTGQLINVVMSLTGLLLLVYFSKRPLSGEITDEGKESPAPTGEERSSGCWARRIALAILLLFCLIIPSDWTQDIPARYGKRHPGLEYSVLYPRIPPADPPGEIE